MPRLLVVEADTALAAILSDVLVAEGYEVGVVTAAPPDPDAPARPDAPPPDPAAVAAAEVIAGGGIDAIVADLPLEGLRTLRAVQRRAAGDAGRVAPVVALVPPTVPPRALRPLALDVELRLPLDLALLVEAVRRVLLTGPVALGAAPEPSAADDETTPDAVHVLAGHLAAISEHFPKLVTRVREIAAGTRNEAEIEESLRSAVRAAAKAEGFAGYLKSFAIDVSDEEGPTDVRRAINYAMQVALASSRSRARIEKQIEEAPLVWCVEAALVRVFVELLVNAVFAIPRGAPEAHTITIATGVDGRGNARVVVSDDGVGIAPEVLEHVFEPFYTTRRQESGVGLGLSLCRDAIAGMGGEIAIESEPGRGTRVQVTLPPASTRARKSDLGRS